MATLKKKTGLIVGLCSAAVLLGYPCGFAAQEQFNYIVPDAVAAFTADDGSHWEQVNAPGFGSAGNFSVVAMAKYKGRLYAMTRNQVQGAEVWRTSGTGWEQVLFPGDETNGFYGNPWLNNVWGRMIEFNGKLYFGVSSGLQGNFLGSTGCEIWRYDGTNWEPVISDEAGALDAGSITAISSCALNDGDSKAYFTDSTQNWVTNEWAGGILRITSGPGTYRKFYILANTATELTIQQMEQAGTGASKDVSTEFTNCAARTYNNPYPSYSYTLGAVSVGDEYEIHMGSAGSGFGDPWNKTITDMLVHDGKLYVSTGLNYEYGGQVWYTADGDEWEVTPSALPAAGSHNLHSFGNFHTDATYPAGLKPISTSITNLVAFNGVLYAGGTGSSGNMGQCGRMARLTAGGWEMIVDGEVDANTTGTNENGFGDGMTCNMTTGNFMPWSFAAFGDKLQVGINSLGGLRILYSYSASADDECPLVGGDTWKYSVGGDSEVPVGFEGETFGDPPNYKNIALNLFPYRDTLYAGIVTQYVPEYAISHDQGAGIWKSRDGYTWSMVTGDSFGDTDVIQFEAFVDYGGALYVSGSKGASSSPAGLGGAKIFRRIDCVTVDEDPALADSFQRYTVTGIATPLPGPDPNPPGFLGASFLKAGDLDADGSKELVVTSVSGASGSFWTADGAVAVFKRTSADLSTWTQSVIRADFAWANDVLIRDVDGDGEVDIMVFDNFLAGQFTNQPAGIYLLRNLGGDVTDPDNWEKVTIHALDPSEDGIDAYEQAKRRASYHLAYFVDIDGDGVEDFVTTRISMEIWQAGAASPLYGRQYMWVEWFRAEEDTGTYPSGFSGPYTIGDGAGFLMGMYDIDGDGLLDVLGPQFFIHNPGSLAVKGAPDGNDPYGDSLVWFRNPGPDAMVDDPATQWERFTIDNWYTSSNPLGQGFDVFPADITNDGRDELIFTTHNHQGELPAGVRIWPSGVYYLAIPDNPYATANWAPVTIDAGDAYEVDRPGSPLTQGSPGFAAAGDVSGSGLADLVVAGDGRGAVYYYEAVPGEGCLSFKRVALYDDPGCMSAEVKLYDLDNDGTLEIIASVYDTSQAKDSSSGSVFIWKRLECLHDSDCPDDNLFCTGAPACLDGVCGFAGNPCVENDAAPVCDEDFGTCVQCLSDADCSESEWCSDNQCLMLCELSVRHRRIPAARLFKPRKVVLTITSEDAAFNIYGQIDLGPLTWRRVRFNQRKNQIRIVAIVPAGLEPGSIPISVGSCAGAVIIE